MKEENFSVRAERLEWAELTESERELVAEAKQMTKHSYSPYSRFAVGAAVRLANGTIVRGSNQENAAYPSGLCAERTAVLQPMPTILPSRLWLLPLHVITAGALRLTRGHLAADAAKYW